MDFTAGHMALGTDEHLARQIVVGMAVILATLAIHSSGAVGTLHVFNRVRRRWQLQHGYVRGLLAMQVVFVSTLISHILNMLVWAWVFLLCGEFGGRLSTAMYFSGTTYTTLGYGDVLLTERWRLLAPMEAASGVLLFGLSAATLFAMLVRLGQETPGTLGSAP